MTGDDIHKFRILTLARGLKLELTGLRVKPGRTIYAIIKQEFGLTGNRQSVYRQFCQMHGLEP